MLTFYLALAQSDNDKDKFEQIYIRYRKLMLSVAYNILGDSELSEDAVHNAFMRILNHLDKLDDVDSPRTKGYVVIVAENVAKTMYTQRKRIVALENEEAALVADDVADARADHDTHDNAADDGEKRIDIEFQLPTLRQSAHEQGGNEESRHVRQAIPPHGEWPDRKRDGIEVLVQIV